MTLSGISSSTVVNFSEKARHTVYVNRAANRTSTVPRHREINDFLARKICRDLQIPQP
jgi:hypothetical protein